MSSWDSKLLAPVSTDATLRDRIDQLFRQQRETWPLFRDGEAALDRIQTKQLLLDGYDVTVQANPGRSISTNAKVDSASIAKRHCFLCPDELPAQERGISFGNFIVLPNPYPILDTHVTIACRSHDPQALEGHINDLLTLTRALGPDMFVLYNGPRCGASAPDHMHFQACSSAAVPLFGQLPTVPETGRTLPLTIGGRNLIVCCSHFADTVQTAVASIVAALYHGAESAVEPMFNLIAQYRNGKYHAILFPRAKHRSACYFAPPEHRLSISPAAVEMAGVIVVADSTHFDRVDETVVRTMYNEVTLDATRFSRLAKELCI